MPQTLRVFQYLSNQSVMFGRTVCSRYLAYLRWRRNFHETLPEKKSPYISGYRQPRWFPIFFIFHPYLGKAIPILTFIFFRWVVQPLTSSNVSKGFYCKNPSNPTGSVAAGALRIDGRRLLRCRMFGGPEFHGGPWSDSPGAGGRERLELGWSWELFFSLGDSTFGICDPDLCCIKSCLERHDMLWILMIHSIDS